MTTTSEDLKGNTLYRCENCRARVAILVPLADRRQVCIDCLPPDQRAVFRAPEPEAPTEL